MKIFIVFGLIVLAVVITAVQGHVIPNDEELVFAPEDVTTEEQDIGTINENDVNWENDEMESDPDVNEQTNIKKNTGQKSDHLDKFEGEVNMPEDKDGDGIPDDYTIVDGDLLVKKSDVAAFKKYGFSAFGAGVQTWSYFKSPKVVIPAVIDVNFKRANKKIYNYILSSIAELNNNTCLNIRPKEPGDSYYIYFKYFTGNQCYTQVASLHEGKRMIALGAKCTHKRTATHHIFHVLGRYHEQTRLDRHRYMKVAWKNLKGSCYPLYYKKWSYSYGVPFNFYSIMFYDDKKKCSHILGDTYAGAFGVVSYPPGYRYTSYFWSLWFGKQRVVTFTDYLVINRQYCAKRGPAAQEITTEEQVDNPAIEPAVKEDNVNWPIEKGVKVIDGETIHEEKNDKKENGEVEEEKFEEVEKPKDKDDEDRILDDYTVVDGDLLIKKSGVAAFKGGFEVSNQAWSYFQNLTDIPYVIDENFYKKNKTMYNYIIGSLKELNNTCLNFRLKKPNEVFYFYFKYFPDLQCYAEVGAPYFGMRLIALGATCTHARTPAALIMRALGRYHEHNRIDRDHYIKLDWSNIHDYCGPLLQRHWSFTYDIPYDYYSVMHWSTSNYCAKNQTKPLFTFVKPGVFTRWVGNEAWLSGYDIIHINKRYCSPKKPKNYSW